MTERQWTAVGIFLLAVLASGLFGLAMGCADAAGGL